jgi:hypothetical protein
LNKNDNLGRNNQNKHFSTPLSESRTAMATAARTRAITMEIGIRITIDARIEEIFDEKTVQHKGVSRSGTPFA